MWGTKMMRRTRGVLGAGLVLALVGCATHHAAPPTAANPQSRPEGRDATGAYRFNMTQDGRRMTADEFDAWMKARGIRVAKGAPGATAQAKAKAPARRPAKAAVATGTPSRAATATKAAPVAATQPKAQARTVAQAGKPKPKVKPAAKEVSAAKAVPKQGSGEG